MIRTRGTGIQVQVYAGRDPPTNRELWRSTTVPGQTRASWTKAREEVGKLLAEVPAGKHCGDPSAKLAQLLDGDRTGAGRRATPASRSSPVRTEPLGRLDAVEDRTQFRWREDFDWQAHGTSGSR